MTSPSPYDSSATPAAKAAPITHFRNEHKFMSNFAVVPGGLAYDGMRGLTVEHVFQAAKTFNPDERARVLAAPTALAAKQLGRTVSLRFDWELVKVGVMARLQSAKYSVPELALQLLQTEDAHLEEGNSWHDRFWGTCGCAKHRRDGAPTGENWLGRILVIQRSVMRG